jgi:hypothetical protein
MELHCRGLPVSQEALAGVGSAPGWSMGLLPSHWWLPAGPALNNPRTRQVRRRKPRPRLPLSLKEARPCATLTGTPVGTVVSSTDQQAVVDTGQTKIGVPLTLIHKDDKGLLLSITGKQFSDAIAKAHARAQTAQQQSAQGQESH